MNNISTTIKKYCLTNGLSLYSLASMLNLKPSSLYRSHKYPSDNMSPLAAENKLLKEKLHHLETEVTYLREIFRLIKSNPTDNYNNLKDNQ